MSKEVCSTRGMFTLLVIADIYIYLLYIYIGFAQVVKNRSKPQKSLIFGHFRVFLSLA